jgi:hypothetical protein
MVEEQAAIGTANDERTNMSNWMKFTYSTTPSDSRAPKKAQSVVRRQARAARKRLLEQEQRQQETRL